MNKFTKKVIVNSFTFSRVLGTVLMPIFYIYLNSRIFLVVVGLLLITDFIDGRLARYWNVRTIFGSLFDMLADKMLALSILVIVGIMFPYMFIPLVFEILIAVINVCSILYGGLGKSSEIGRIKMWIVGVSIFVLLFINICFGLHNNLVQFSFIKFILINSKNIEFIVIGLSCGVEFIVLCDYFIKMLNNIKNSKKNVKITNISFNIKFIKKVLFDEEYYIKTIDKPLSEKLLNV